LEGLPAMEGRQEVRQKHKARVTLILNLGAKYI